MTQNIEEIEKFSLPLPIATTARRIAWQFSQQQPTPEKAKQVQLNTLAVCVVYDYLQMMGISANLKASDSWNPVMRLCCDVADLEVTGLGRIECRPIGEGEQTCYTPLEVWEDRIGYIVVQLDESLRTATLVGFTAEVTTEQLHLNQLQPLEDLLAHLHRLQHPVAAAHLVTNSQAIVNLSRWLHSVFENGWSTVEAVLFPPDTSLALNFRKTEPAGENNLSRLEGRVRRAKLIDLGMQLAGHSVALIVEIRPESAQKTVILLQVHPTGKQPYLPPLLQLVVIDEAGANFLEAQARRADNYIQLQFSGRPGEKFSVKVALGEVSIIENFAI